MRWLRLITLPFLLLRDKCFPRNLTALNPCFSAYSICCLSFITEPNAPPDNVTKFNTSSTSIVVQWDQVPPADQNGVILSYTVTYSALASMSGKTELVHAPTRAAFLTGLNEFTSYSITVFASTSKGGGNKSAPIIVITDEDSKFIQHLFPSSAYYQKQ